MTEPLFRLDEGVPHVGDRSYPWRDEVWDRECAGVWFAEFSPAGFYEGFRLRTENAWEMQVIWTPGCPADTDGDDQCWRKNCPCQELDDLLPAGSMAIVDCNAVDLLDSMVGHLKGEWPHGTPFNWSFPRLYVDRQERFEEVLAEMSTRPSPTWL